MDITIVKGNPTDDEVAALTAVLTELEAEARAKRGTGERDLWGTPTLSRHFSTVFNPGAFSNVTYF
ncbi:acyl-CoA carboxylase subunit epsilon [Corynebacterium liangguodongii]|uniref:Acyl-CoA carboxylase subunit epsilon n=1 Tax=Corynebacterium liangguodongii TaxID=2079535 RepID=A0A2S0WCK9_9CORY|nr:acyl-CoA carboxylase subunit epsilon [Corynebacterium liangguodongii]AWB83509.1 acyl-CoA carboxylase subunit epsilon [Corynebacterium liangguodongii]PWC00402.1 acyl-CoA carboxylase subunit epsilon [Corynebacterium liangguodongii]